MAPPDETRKKKACQNCTHAKAKCLPYENRPDLCHRCQRLNKQCVFENMTRRKGRAKTRSRVQQLEQRVETLMNVLVVNGHSTESLASHPSLAESETPGGGPDTTPYPPDIAASASISTGPADTPDSPDDASVPESYAAYEESNEPYDPVDAGLIDYDKATALLHRFRNSFVWSFPYVVIPATATVDSLRTHQPFLFHSIMATMAYDTPAIQRILGEHLKTQIASRIINQSHKSIEILQGLLVHAAWYHSFFRIHNQQISIILHLCVAMIQDLGFSKNPKDKARRFTLTDPQCDLSKVSGGLRSPDEKRAVLGTHYLLSAFAHAWRKRNTMQYTKFMEQCCQSIATANEVPTDALIPPLSKIGELMCRINDYYSYDDIENAEISGETTILMSTRNFIHELERIKDSVPNQLRSNDLLRLQFDIADVWIHEISLHSFLWISDTHNASLSLDRIKLLYRTMNGVKAYINTLVNIPQNSLYYISFPAWSGWFYAVIIACKLVFLNETETEGQSGIETVPSVLSKLLPAQYTPGSTHEFYSVSDAIGNIHLASWDPVSVAKESGIQQIFERFVDKLAFVLEKPAPKDRHQARDTLFSIACLQKSLLHGFCKRMEAHTEKRAPAPRASQVPSLSEPSPAATHAHSETSQPFHPTHSHAERSCGPQAFGSIPTAGAGGPPFPWNIHGGWHETNYNTMQPQPHFDPNYSMQAQMPTNTYDDWVWNSMMDFSMPSM